MGSPLPQVVFVVVVVALYTLALDYVSRSRSAHGSGGVDPQRRGSLGETKRRRDAIVEMARHAWGGYIAGAAGADELKPLSNTSTNRWGRILVTPIDSLDTLWMMGLRKEFEQAKEIVKHLSFRQAGAVSFFETVIRHVGGSLSAFALTNDTFFLQTARRVAEGLLHAFDGPLPFPCHKTVFSGTKLDNQYFGKGHHYMLAEVGSFQMEFRFLSSATGDERFAALADRVNRHFVRLVESEPGWPSGAEWYQEGQPRMPHKGLFPTFITPEGKFSGAAGYAGMMDSFYEYVLKQWIQFGKRDDSLRELYEDAVEGMLLHLVRYAPRTHFAVLGYLGFTYHATMDHLSCFVPGMLALGVMHGVHDEYPGRKRTFSTKDVLDVAADLATTCYRFYADSPSGVAPDVVEFFLNGSYVHRFPQYLLRPEVVESMFYLHRLTRDARYRDWAWHIAVAINRTCRTKFGFAAVADTRDDRRVLQDSMESFFISETLKYLFLTFSDDAALDLDRWVLTTEAHPLPVQSRFN